ncbi:MAG: glycosyltransferase family 4 protein [Proteobacteria bacterium]|nr:glycosyltransferase family 4 protein [Pseudomonadota bacterium]
MIFNFGKMVISHLRVQLIGIKGMLASGEFWRALRASLVLARMVFLLAMMMGLGALIFAPFPILRAMLSGFSRLMIVPARALLTKESRYYSKLSAWYWLIFARLGEVSRGAWSLAYKVMSVGDFAAILYLNQFAARATALGGTLNPDFVHAHDLVTLSCGYRLARLTGARLIYDAHELETHTNYWSLSDSHRRWIAFYEEALSRQTDAVITVCDSISDWLHSRYKIARPVVVHNSPDFSHAENTTPEKGTLRDALGLCKDTPLAIYVGSVTLDRGIEECVRAMQFAPNLHFAFVGPRYSETEKNIRQISDELGVRDRIHLVNPVPPAEVTQFISDADCSVVAIQNVCLSYYFCFPNKLLESVLAGIPVVVARLIELENFVRKFKVGLVADETDPKALARAMVEVIENKDKFRPDLETRSEILLQYGWETQRARLLELYHKLKPQELKTTED